MVEILAVAIGDNGTLRVYALLHTPIAQTIASTVASSYIMSRAIELYQSRVSHIVAEGGCITIHLPYAYIYKAKGSPGRDPGSGWGQEVAIIMENAAVTPLPYQLPAMISDGYFEIDGVRYELVPVPLGEHAVGRLHLVFVDGGILEVTGSKPVIQLTGRAIPLEEFS